MLNIDTQEVEQGQAYSPWACTIIIFKQLLLCHNEMEFLQSELLPP
jgi:hypothetical protein